MDRYILSELIPPLLFGVGLFSSVSVSIGVWFELVRKVVESGLPLLIAMNVFLLSLPQFILYSFPMSVLLATLMTYSRLSSDSELIALRSCGVSVYRLVLPALMLSLLVAGITFVFRQEVVPAANYQADLTLNRALKRETPTFQERNIIYPEFRDAQQPDGSKAKVMSRLIYADQFDGQKMKGLTIIDRSRDGLNQILVAETGEWNIGQNTWDFYNGTIYVVAADSSYRNILRFQHQQLQLPQAPFNLAKRKLDYDEMNIATALEQLELIRHSGDEQKIRKLKVRIQQQISFPFVCLVFGLVGSSLGIRPQRTAKATSFGVSVVVIFSFYMLDQFISGLGIAGILSPVVAAWLPNIFGLSVGGLLLFKAAQR
ncbi:MAG: LptF/LptG family permease [Nostocaceae cyanobacterium]|nr:LptF/LptG family permease [Nostocaceae cyanobacterium]